MIIMLIFHLCKCSSEKHPITPQLYTVDTNYNKQETNILYIKLDIHQIVYMKSSALRSPLSTQHLHICSTHLFYV